MKRAVLLVTILMMGSVHAESSADHPGAAVYAQHCASCHDHTEDTAARPLEALQRIMPGLLEYALTDGKMSVQGQQLNAAQMTDLMNFLTGRTATDQDWVSAAMCAPQARDVDLSMAASVSTFGLGPKNHRYLSSAAAGLEKSDVEHLELAWAFAFPNIDMMRSQPAIVGETMFITPVDSRQLYAINLTGQPCVKWVYDSDAPLRSAVTYGKREPDGRGVLVIGDAAGRVHQVDAASGTGLWLADLKLFPQTMITGTPQLVGDRVYASVSQFEIMVGAQEAHECCKSHGAVAALDAVTGRVVWLTHTMPDATPQRDRGDGRMIWGPSGAPVWTSPAIDLKRGVLYVGTGEATSEPAHKHTDAILALDLEDGKIRWSFQATANDIFLAGCRRGKRSLNCPPETSVERDVDFGASVIIAQRSDGRDILLAGQKSSDVWALDPDNDGALVWHWNNGRGTANGGIHWGMAFDGQRLFAALSDPGRPRPGFVPQPGLYALDVNTGALLWEHRTEADCEGREARMPYCQYLYGFSAATLVMGEVVAQGSLDGYLRLFDATSGKLLFQYDTVRDYEGVNGVPGRGGAIDNASIVAAGGTLYVSSGYGMFGQTGGNVLLAFKPKRFVSASP